LIDSIGMFRPEDWGILVGYPRHIQHVRFERIGYSFCTLDQVAPNAIGVLQVSLKNNLLNADVLHDRWSLGRVKVRYCLVEESAAYACGPCLFLLANRDARPPV
ncbi:hypothetical protein THAOC_34735, partial [Thalassiosira oceanica]